MTRLELISSHLGELLARFVKGARNSYYDFENSFLIHVIILYHS